MYRVGKVYLRVIEIVQGQREACRTSQIQGSGSAAEMGVACMGKRPRCVDSVEKRSLELGDFPGMHESRKRSRPQVVPALSEFESLSKRSFLLQFAPRLV